MRVIKVLHGFSAEVDAKVLQLRGFGVLKPKHVQNADKTIGRGVSHRVVQSYHGLASSRAAAIPNSRSLLAGHLERS